MVVAVVVAAVVAVVAVVAAVAVVAVASLCATETLINERLMRNRAPADVVGVVGVVVVFVGPVGPRTTTPIDGNSVKKKKTR